MAAPQTSDMSALVSELRSLLGEENVLTGNALLRTYECDAYTVDRRKPDAVALPASTQEVSQVIRCCRRHGVPYIPRGAGTGLSGGALPVQGGVILGTQRLRSILKVDLKNRVVKAQAGTINTAITKAAAPAGLRFAPDPSSQVVSTIGGNIAENSGGPHTLKYGVTAPHVLGVTLVDAQGEILELGGPVEGGPGFDFLGLVSGSEGTIGMITEAWLKLTPRPKAVETALASFPTVRDATESVARIVSEGVLPAALEMIDRNVLGALNAAFGLEFPPGTQALLLAECDGEPEAVREEIAQVARIFKEQNAIDVKTAANAEERAALWKARKSGVAAMGRLAPTLVTHDGVIPRSRLPELLDFVYETAREHELNVANMFHAGDGNLHPIFYFDSREPGKVEAVAKAGEKIVAKCVEVGGSVTGEHGVGVEKAELLHLMFDEADLRLQKDVKAIFEPDELTNPLKLLPDQRGYSEAKANAGGAAS
ncbi:MAG: FAD-binding oxidoreductase [Fimbriimonadaceae bacterium]